MTQSIPNWLGPLAFAIWILSLFWAAHKHKTLHDIYAAEISRVVGYEIQGIGLPFSIIFSDEADAIPEVREVRRLQREYCRALFRLISVPVAALFAFLLSGWLWITIASLF